MKIKMMQNMPKVFHAIIKHKFPDTVAGSPTDSKGFYDDIEKILNE